jgi:hypothetical protein
VSPATKCQEPEAGTRIWRWIESGDGEAILQLEASTLGKDDEQEVDPVITLFTPDEIQENPGVVVDRWHQSGGWNQQVEREGRRNWKREIGGQVFFVNHYRITPEWADFGLDRAKRNIRVDDWEFTLRRPVAHSVLTGCGIPYQTNENCPPEAGARLWRWVYDEEKEVILQLESSTTGGDLDQVISPVVTIFTPQEIPEDHAPRIWSEFKSSSLASSPSTVTPAELKVERVGEWNRVVCVFQPHRYTRTSHLWSAFAHCFEAAEVVAITDIYPAGEQAIPGVTGELIWQAVTEAHPEQDVTFAASLEEAADFLVGTLRPGDLCLTLGAGDLTKIPDWVISELSSR